MKKNLLSVIIAIIAINISPAVYAQISKTAEGIYNGTLEVYLMEPQKTPLGTSSENVYLSATDDDHITLEIKNFTFKVGSVPLDLGDIKISDVALEKEGDNIILTPKTVELNLNVVGKVNVYLQRSTVINKKLTLSLNVETTPPYPDMYIYIDFKGVSATGITDISTENKPTVYYDSTADVLIIKGVENQKYAIFNLTGVHTMTGIVTSDNINVSNLSRGIYLIKIGNNTIKFIKQ